MIYPHYATPRHTSVSTNLVAASHSLPGEGKTGCRIAALIADQVNEIVARVVVGSGRPPASGALEELEVAFPLDSGLLQLILQVAVLANDPSKLGEVPSLRFRKLRSQ
jgi:hypothetical protein